jgi:hypothetical protein
VTEREPRRRRPTVRVRMKRFSGADPRDGYGLHAPVRGALELSVGQAGVSAVSRVLAVCKNGFARRKIR